MQWKRGRPRDPACGMHVDPKVARTRTIQGVTYYFCNEECAQRFEEQTSTKPSQGQTYERTSGAAS